MTETNKARLIATGVIALALIAAAPVFADDSNSNSNNGLRIGSIIKLWNDERKEERKERIEDRREARKDVVNANATSSNQFSIEGTVTSVNGSTLTVQGKHGAVYTVSAANATITGHNNTTLSLGSIAVNDKVKVTGTLTGSVIIATKIKDKSDETGKTFRAISAGIVTAINGSTVIFDKFGAHGTTTATTNANTKFKIGGNATSSSALKVGSHVIIAGTTTATGSTINASIVYILTEGLNWLKHIFR